jgi:hypothetical protein
MSFPFFVRKALYAVFFVFTVSIAAAGGKAETAPPPQEAAIIASTSWVAAIADAAGAQNIRILAPVKLCHPPEYELKPSDLEAAGRGWTGLDIILLVILGLRNCSPRCGRILLSIITTALWVRPWRKRPAPFMCSLLTFPARAERGQ